jgi:hypothetical protein
MKHAIIYILITSFLLQSCYSYKTIDLNKTSLTQGKKYKYNTVQNKKFEKVTIKSSNDTIIIAKTGRKEKQITFADIKTIKVRKFSVIKTIALVPVSIVTLAIGAFLIDPKINVPIGN